MTPGAGTPVDVRILGPVRWYVSGRPLAAGRAAEVIGELRALTARHPLREPYGPN